MTVLENIPQILGTSELWIEDKGVYWLNNVALNLRELAHRMNRLHARFVTITAYELPAGAGFRLEYHWDIEGRLMGFPFHISERSIDSIYDLCEAADWIEREIHEGYAIDFAGRAYEPLLLRQDRTAGVNLREELV